MRRQELLDRPDPQRLFFVLDEARTHREVGVASVMRHQIRRLIEMTDRPNVTLDVISFSAGFRAAMANHFCIMEFPDTADPAVHLEGNREEFERLRKMYMGPKAP